LRRHLTGVSHGWSSAVRDPVAKAMVRLFCAGVLLGACATRDSQSSASDSQKLATDSGRLDTATAAFLALFEAPADTVRVRGATALRLWDQLIVAEAPAFDPLREMNAAATRWEQIQGDPVRLDAASSLDATAHLPSSGVPARYVFRLTMRNTSGQRTVELPVVVQP
jgi:hypothetical protein